MPPSFVSYALQADERKVKILSLNTMEKSVSFLTGLTQKRNSAQGQFYFLTSLKPRINTAQVNCFIFTQA